MKLIFPRNIEKGWFSGLTFYIGPIKITIFQLIALAIGAALMLGVTNTMMKNGYERIVAIIAGLPFLLIAILIAFFEISEMNLVQFSAKMLRTYVFDSPKKFFCNVADHSQSTLAIKKRQSEEKKEEIIKKDPTSLEKNVIHHEIISSILEKS